LNEKLNEKLNRIESVRSRDDDAGGCGEARARAVCVLTLFLFLPNPRFAIRRGTSQTSVEADEERKRD